MELILIWYVVGAFLVALAATVDLFHPVISANKNLPVTERFIYYFVLFVLALLKAPLLIYPCVNKFRGLEFRDALSSSLFSK